MEGLLERRKIYREYIEQVVKEGEASCPPERQEAILDMIVGVGTEEYRPLAKLLLLHWEELESGLPHIPSTICEAIRIRAKELQIPARYLALYWLALEGSDQPCHGQE